MQSTSTPTNAVLRSPRRPTKHSGATTSVTLDRLYLSRTGNTYTTCASQQHIKDTTRISLEAKDMLNAMWVIANQYVQLQNQYPLLIKSNKKVSYFVQQTPARTSQKVSSNLLDSSMSSIRQVLNQTNNSSQQQIISDLQQESLLQQVNVGKLQQQELELSIELKKIAVAKTSTQSDISSQLLQKKLILASYTAEQKKCVVSQIDSRNSVIQAKKDAALLRASQLSLYSEPRTIIKDAYALYKKTLGKPDSYGRGIQPITIKFDESLDLNQSHIVFGKLEAFISSMHSYIDNNYGYKLEYTYLQDRFDLFVSTHLLNYKSTLSNQHDKRVGNRDLIYDAIRLRESLSCQQSIIANQQKLTFESALLSKIAAKHEDDMRVLQKEAQIKIQLNTQLRQDLIAKHDQELHELQLSTQKLIMDKESQKRDSIKKLQSVNEEISQIQAGNQQVTKATQKKPVRIGFWSSIIKGVTKDDDSSDGDDETVSVPRRD